MTSQHGYVLLLFESMLCQLADLYSRRSCSRSSSSAQERKFSSSLTALGQILTLLIFCGFHYINCWLLEKFTIQAHFILCITYARKCWTEKNIWCLWSLFFLKRYQKQQYVTSSQSRSPDKTTITVFYLLLTPALLPVSSTVFNNIKSTVQNQSQ